MGIFLVAAVLYGLTALQGAGARAVAVRDSLVGVPHSQRQAAKDLLQAAELQSDAVLAARAAWLSYERAHFRLSREALLYWQTLEPHDYRIDNLLILTDLETGHLGQSLTVLSGLVRHAAHPHLAIENLLQVLARASERAPRLTLFQNWVHEARTDPLAHWTLARVATGEGLPGLAAHEYQQLFHSRPAEPSIGLALAKSWIHLGQEKRGLALARALEKKGLIRSLASRIRYAELLALGGHAKEAERLIGPLCKTAVPLAPLTLAWIQIQQKQYRHAEETLTRLLEKNAANRTAGYFLGYVEADLKHFRRALAWFHYARIGPHFIGSTREITRIEVESHPPHLRQALLTLEKNAGEIPIWGPRLVTSGVNLFVQTGQNSQGVSLLAWGLKRWPENTDLQYAEALLSIHLGHFRKAIRVLRTLVRRYPGDPLFLNALGYTWVIRGRHLLQAAILIHHALVLDPSDPALLDSLGWVDFKLHHWRSAYRHLALAHTLKPEEPTIAFHWGRVLWQSGHPQAARRVWKKALELAPHDERLKRALSQPLPHP
jgi:tetratricopeptide (TPR) repeat protein